MIRELSTPGELAAACGDDDLVMWAAQGLAGGGRAWAGGRAVVAGAPGISRRDRLAVWGDPADAAAVLRHALAELGPSYRPLGEADLMRQVAERVPGLGRVGVFSWMSLEQVPIGPSDGVSWLEGRFEGQIGRLLAEHAPDSYAVPGGQGVARWAGVRVEGRLAAVAADAWSAPSVGFVAGVATAAPWRGAGLAGRVCRWVSGRLVAAHGRAALMVDDDNVAALRLYAGLGYRRRAVAACVVS
ncbi:GNAT family N-acetyltransferase [Nonomuraea sp. NPDC003804]|uniref:GNAT family N-acetyltransferase n=1 Tax=Nonomuraea sp. NPDC003804 TaxID=3154547 RepID=UPI0033A02FDF